MFEPDYPTALTFAALAEANALRLPRFKNAKGEPAHSEPDGSDWSLTDWTNAVAGEAGESCNFSKKLKRGDFGAPGTPGYLEGCRLLAYELADAVIYADIACRRAGFSLEQMVREKFNIVSDRVGCHDLKL